MDKSKVWSVVVGCLVKHADKILILKRGESEDSYPGIWELPSGKVEFGETLAEAVCREVKEETGLVIVNPQLFGYFHYLVEKPDVTKYAVQINFLAETNAPDVSLTEHVEFKFIGLNELNDYEITPNVKEQIYKVLSSLR